MVVVVGGVSAGCPEQGCHLWGISRQAGISSVQLELGLEEQVGTGTGQWILQGVKSWQLCSGCP